MWRHYIYILESGSGMSSYLSRRSRCFIFLLLLMMNTKISVKGLCQSQPQLTGFTSLSFMETFPGNATDNSWSQSLSLDWKDQLYKNQIDLGLDMLIEKPSSEDIQFRPTWSMDVRGDQYDLTLKYSDYRDDDYLNGQVPLISKYENINLVLTPPDLPRITLNYTGNRYLDDQEVHSVNNENNTLTLKGDYQLGDLNISASRTDYSFWSDPQTQNSQNQGLVALAVDNGGYVYTISNISFNVQVYTSAGTFVSQWGNFGAGLGQFMSPVGIAVDNSGNVYVSDAQLHTVQKFTNTGTFITQWGGYGSSNGKFNSPNGLAVDNLGYIYVVDQGNQRIQKFTNAGSFITAWGTSGTGDGDFNSPVGICLDQNNNVYVTDQNNHRVQKFDSSGDYLAQWGTVGNQNGQFNTPTGITSDNQGYIYVMDYGNQRVQRFTTAGIYINKWSAYGSQSGNSIAIGPAVHIFVANIQVGLVQTYASDGSYISNFGNFVTITSSQSWYKIVTNQLALNYAIHPSEYFDVNMGYNVTNTHQEGTSVATTNTLYQQYSLGWRVIPNDVFSLYGNHGWTLTDENYDNGTSSNSNQVTHDFGINLKPYELTNINLDYSISKYTEDTSSNTQTNTGTLNVTSQLYPDLSLNGNYSHSETFSMDTKTSITDQVTMTLTGQLLPEASADLYGTYNQTNDIADQINSNNETLGIRFRSHPTDKFLWNETLQYTDSQSKTTSDGTTSNSNSSQWTITTELNEWIRASLNLFADGTYTLNSDQSNNFTYTVGYTWRPKNIFYMTNSFSQTLGETNSSTFDSTLEFRFRYQTSLDVGYQYFEEQGTGTTQTVFARFTKNF
jgi:hypothetical protein